jgi:tetratricopeptide (TPR) repeat protein
MRAYTLLSLLILHVNLAQGEEAPPQADLELAKAHFNTGQIYYDRGRFPDAAHEFEEAYRLSGKPALLYNMGKSYDGSSDAARALKAYRQFLASVKESSDRLWVIGRVDQLEKIVGRLQITSTIDASTVKLDGAEIGATPLKEPVEVNPGSHEIEISHEGYSTWKSKVVASPGQLIEVAGEPKSMVKIVRVEVDKSTPVYKRWWLWTAIAAVAVVAVGVGVGVGVGGAQGDGVSGPHAQLPAVK